MARVARRVGIVILTIGVAGCIGATDRSDFDAEVRARGGGVTAGWIADAFESTALSVGETSSAGLAVLAATINPTNRTTTVTARRGDRPDFVDVVIVREGEVLSVTPVPDADELPLDDITIAFSDLPIDQIEAMADQALDEFGEPDGFVNSIEITLTNGEPTIRIKMESSRQTGDAVFAVDGALQDVLR